MKIYLSNSAFLGTFDAFLKGFETANPNELFITTHPKWVSVHPVVLAMVAALGLRVKPENAKYQESTARSIHYFERMGLFKLLGINSGIKITEHEPAGRFIPITQIQNSDQLDYFLKEMVPLFHLEAAQAKTIKYVISELVRNVLEHAEANEGAILAAQYYPRSKTIRLGIVDSGLGIRKTISRSHDANTDIDAIRLALTPGITGTTKREGGTEQNAGAGLFFIKSIATRNRNFLVVYSGSGMYKLLKRPPGDPALQADPFEDRHTRNGSMPYWQGTVVGIDITLDMTEEFSDLLDAILPIYEAAIRERKKAAKHKKPHFI